MAWIVREQGVQLDKIEFLGSKFLIGNGKMGYRGAMEEYGKAQLKACTLAGLYDRNGERWREPVNAPDVFRVNVVYNGEQLSLLTSDVLYHEQTIDLSCSLHVRETVFHTSEGVRVTIRAERFLSLDRIHTLAMRFEATASASGKLSVQVGIDGEIWDINGPHLHGVNLGERDGVVYYDAQTVELGCRVSAAQIAVCATAAGVTHMSESGPSAGRRFAFVTNAGEKHVIECFNTIRAEPDQTEDALEAAIRDTTDSRQVGYDRLLENSKSKWSQLWAEADVKIEGDDEAQLALRYSIYLLLVSTPFHTDKVAIPGRGLSGQVYKGAMFWDTEVYMLPLFLYTMPETARNLVMYRVRTLDGARAKAAEYGYRGAFYAWESQETGIDSCTHYNINDIFTGRPLRTYFRDKQVHISADVAYGIWQYYRLTGDESILTDGGAEVIWECARFFYAYAYFKTDKGRFELLDVTGADEYHERVNNSAFTNAMVKLTLDAALRVADHLRRAHPASYEELMRKLDFEDDYAHIKQMSLKLYVPEASGVNQLIEQFDGYFQLEDTVPDVIRKRMLKPNEYLGSPTGLAVDTQMIKQADVVLLTTLFRERYSLAVKKANWDYYEPRTEHGSSLSTCVYALAAADFGEAGWAYNHFMKAATIDLHGDYKLYVGDLYIGGTHPAANGGSWMVAVLGFGGLDANEREIRLNPRLPERWTCLEYRIHWRGQRFKITATPDGVSIEASADNTETVDFNIHGQHIACPPAASITRMEGGG